MRDSSGAIKQAFTNYVLVALLGSTGVFASPVKSAINENSEIVARVAGVAPSAILRAAFPNKITCDVPAGGGYVSSASWTGDHLYQGVLDTKLGLVCPPDNPQCTVDTTPKGDAQFIVTVAFTHPDSQHYKYAGSSIKYSSANQPQTAVCRDIRGLTDVGEDSKIVARSPGIDPSAILANTFPYRIQCIVPAYGGSNWVSPQTYWGGDIVNGIKVSSSPPSYTPGTNKVSVETRPKQVDTPPNIQVIIVDLTFTDGNGGRKFSYAGMRAKSIDTANGSIHYKDCSTVQKVAASDDSKVVARAAGAPNSAFIRNTFHRTSCEYPSSGGYTSSYEYTAEQLYQGVITSPDPVECQNAGPNKCKVQAQPTNQLAVYVYFTFTGAGGDRKYTYASTASYYWDFDAKVWKEKPCVAPKLAARAAGIANSAFIEASFKPVTCIYSPSGGSRATLMYTAHELYAGVLKTLNKPTCTAGTNQCKVVTQPRGNYQAEISLTFTDVAGSRQYSFATASSYYYNGRWQTGLCN